MKSSAVFAVLGIFLPFPLAAQVGGAQMGTTPAAGIGGQTSSQANPTLSGGNGASANSSRAVYVSGRVAIEGGAPLPSNVAIERVCGGIAKAVSYTDSGGRFNFKWGDTSVVVADASDAGSGPSGRSGGGGFGGSQSAGGASPLGDPFGNRMVNCGIRARLAGYRSDTVNLFSREGSDVGIIVLHRLGEGEGSSVSVTSLLAPKDAKKAYDRGLDSLQKNKPADAVKDFEKATALYPKYADAWMSLGKMRLGQQSREAARAAFLKAVDADPKLVPAWLELGVLAAAEAKWIESAEYLDQAVKLDPVDFPLAWYTDAVANYNLGRYDAAEKSAREAVKLDPRHANPRAGYLLGLALAEKKDYAGAAAELAAFIKLAPDAPDLASVKNRLAEIEKLAGVTKQTAEKQ